MFEMGQKVKDKFKTPRPGDESVYGQVTAIMEAIGGVEITMETGPARVKRMPAANAELVYEVVEGEADDGG